MRTKAAADAIQFTLDASTKEDQTVNGLANRSEEVEQHDPQCPVALMLQMTA